MNRNENKQYLYWINGLKGIACFAIAAHHFLLAFYPGTYWQGTVQVKQTFDLKRWYWETPLSVVTNGNYMVCIFCVLSGLLCAYGIMANENMQDGKISRSIFKRYFRLAVPIFVLSLFVYLMQKAGMFLNLEISEVTDSVWLGEQYQVPFTLKDVVLSSFVKVLFVGDSTFSTAFWMLHKLFTGSFLAYMIGIVAIGRFKDKIIIFFLLLAGIYISSGDYLLACFVFGALLSYMIVFFSKPQIKLPVFFYLVLIVFALFLGGYPTYGNPDNVYHFLDYCLSPFSNTIQPANLCHCIGAFLLILGIHNIGIFKKFLSAKIFDYMGKISFSVYLVHIPILLSLSMHLFKFFISKMSYFAAVFIVFLITLAVTAVSAWLFYIIFEKNINRLTGKLVGVLERV